MAFDPMNQKKTDRIRNSNFRTWTQLLSETDGCVSREECSCRSQGVVYSPGDISQTQLADPCQKDCRCVEGAVRCQQAECVKESGSSSVNKSKNANRILFIFKI